jgi:hypothetical protein
VTDPPQSRASEAFHRFLDHLPFTRNPRRFFLVIYGVPLAVILFFVVLAVLDAILG